MRLHLKKGEITDDNKMKVRRLFRTPGRRHSLHYRAVAPEQNSVQVVWTVQQHQQTQTSQGDPEVSVGH